MYEDANHGMFSKKLAEWAIGNMEIKDATTGNTKPLRPHTIDEMQDAMKENGIELPDEFLYSAWYLYNMAYADYPKSLATDSSRVKYVEETLCDPDCCPEAVLECFVAKMCVMGIPIHWERMI